MSLFSKKNLTSEKLKEEASEVYSEVFDAGKTEAMAELAEELTEAKALSESLQLELKDFRDKEEKTEAEKVRVTEITKVAKAFNLVAKGTELIESNVSVSDAVSQLIEAKDATEENSAYAFDGSAASIAGPDSTDSNDDEPTNLADAQRLIQKREGCSLADARGIAAKEFKNLIPERGQK